MNNLKIGSFLQALRKAKGVTQAEVATYFDISPKTVSKWECGDALPEVPLLKALAEYYEVTIDEILNGEKGRSTEPSKIRIEHNTYLYQKKIKVLTIFFILSIGLIIMAMSIFFIIFYAIKNDYHGEIALFTYCLISSISLILFIIAVYISGSVQKELDGKQYRSLRRKKYCYSYIVIACILFGFTIVYLGMDSNVSMSICYSILFAVLIGIGIIYIALFHLISHKNY